jgi:hypothetical protein
MFYFLSCLAFKASNGRQGANNTSNFFDGLVMVVPFASAPAWHFSAAGNNESQQAYLFKHS